MRAPEDRIRVHPKTFVPLCLGSLDVNEGESESAAIAVFVARMHVRGRLQPSAATIMLMPSSSPKIALKPLYKYSKCCIYTAHSPTKALKRLGKPFSGYSPKAFCQ
jgi:hypothetical protein